MKETRHLKINSIGQTEKEWLREREEGDTHKVESLTEFAIPNQLQVCNANTQKV